MNIRGLLSKMEREWDARAIENAMHYIATLQESWTEEEFTASGRTTIKEHVLNDMFNICQGRDPKAMCVLEIGCGAGRLTKALAEVFGEVHGVDVSGAMIKEARQVLRAQPNAFVYQNNGMDLEVVGELRFDFAFSCLVFQHIPSPEIIENYFREVSRVLKPGDLFKCQVQGRLGRPPKNNTWFGTLCPRKLLPKWLSDLALRRDTPSALDHSTSGCGCSSARSRCCLSWETALIDVAAA